VTEYECRWIIGDAIRISSSLLERIEIILEYPALNRNSIIVFQRMHAFRNCLPGALSFLVLRYPRHAQNRAVSVRRDGSVNSYWPNGDLAVTVDLDQVPVPGSNGSMHTIYRMFAMYRATGNVAVSFETGPSGGFVQVR
jgi:hypothetical protein